MTSKKMRIMSVRTSFLRQSSSLNSWTHSGIDLRIIFIFFLTAFYPELQSSGPCNSTGTGFFFFKRLPKATQQYTTPHTAGASTCRERKKIHSFSLAVFVCVGRTPTLPRYCRSQMETAVRFIIRRTKVVEVAELQ